ncbi:unnamed protein product [Parascedosporium putredinis]|uniref:CN hydrolase domain-containing protein n=1 Tax=Parascedosporium putredinis TaxID=1442378 RepID=A0A9P1M9Z3_9PEZI|nr:unnamed protein product [Parascedosporium putredinis]CAI7992995.1 unnamed protein product [Parascedosporium putredinis]
MRIACLQFNPHLGDVNNNLTRADRVLGRANPENLDLIVLPEMAFTVAHLPEYYNSVAVIGPDGDDVAHHRKAHLYYTDETWALEGDGFYGAHITGLGQTAMGICMDINPYKFQEPWDKFEFAYHVLESDANLVIVSMAWLTLESESEFSTLPQEPDMNTLTYWAMRMEPIIRSETKDEIIFVFANRCGTEGEAVYAGTSAVLGIKDGEVNVYGVLGRGDKKVLIADTNQPPIAKLVLGNQAGSIKRPDTTAPGHRDIPHLDGTAASVSHQRDYEEILAGPRHSSRDQTADWVATQIIPPAQAAGRRDANPEPRNGSQRIASAAAAPADRRGAHEPRAASSHGGSNFTYESSRVGKMAPPKLTIPETTPSRPRQNIDSSAKIGTPIHKSTRTPVRRRSNRNLGHEPLSRPSRLPDSAVVMSAIEPSTTMNALFSPHDSALGRVTPEVVSGRSHRKSSSRKSSKPRDADPRNHRFQDSPRAFALEELPLHIEADVEEPERTPLAKAAFERLRDPEDKAPKEAEPAQLGEEEKVSAVEDEPRDQGIAELESLSSGQPDEITEDVADKEPETEELELDGQEAREEDDAQIPIAVAISGDVDVVPDGEGNHELTAPSPRRIPPQTSPSPNFLGWRDRMKRSDYYFSSSARRVRGVLMPDAKAYVSGGTDKTIESGIIEGEKIEKLASLRYDRWPSFASMAPVEVSLLR